MPLPSNPQTLANYDITKGDQAKIFVKKVSDLFLSISQTLTPNGLAAILNGSGVITSTDLFRVSVNLGSVATNQTINCAGANGVFVNLVITAALTLSLTNLSDAVPVYVRMQNSTGGGLLFKITGTNAAAGAFTNVLAVFVSNGAESSMITGVTIPGTTVQHWSGMAVVGTTLAFISL